VVTGARGEGLTVQTDAFGGGFTDTFRDCFAAFYSAAETGVRDPRLATFRDGAANAAVCAAIARSARSGGGFVEVGL
jgi:predicted dehydrogenase